MLDPTNPNDARAQLIYAWALTLIEAGKKLPADAQCELCDLVCDLSDLMIEHKPKTAPTALQEKLDQIGNLLKTWKMFPDRPPFMDECPTAETPITTAPAMFWMPVKTVYPAPRRGFLPQ